MARFRSGTLERSVRRWGRMPKFGRGKLERVKHSWKYVELENTAMSLNGASSAEVVLHDSADWVPATSGGVGCKNVAFDLNITCTWTPVGDSANIFLNGQLLMGIFIQDADDVQGGPIADVFGECRALVWDQFVWRSEGMDLATPTGAIFVPPILRWNRRVRGKARYLKFDEELRLSIGPQNDLTSTIDDMRLSVFGRVSWETP